MSQDVETDHVGKKSTLKGTQPTAAPRDDVPKDAERADEIANAAPPLEFDPVEICGENLSATISRERR